jgi:hypothetical protein
VLIDIFGRWRRASSLANQEKVRVAGLAGRNIITKYIIMRISVSPGTALLAMSAPSRIAAAMVVAACLWLCVWGVT